MDTNRRVFLLYLSYNEWKFRFFQRFHHRQLVIRTVWLVSAWRRGRWELAAPRAKGKNNTAGLAPNQAQVAAIIPLLCPPPPPPLSRPPRNRIPVEKQRVFFGERSAVTYRRNLGPTAHLQRQRLLLSHSRRLSLLFVAPHPRFFFSLVCFISAMKSSLDPEKALRTRQGSTLPLLPSSSPWKAVGRRRGPS